MTPINSFIEHISSIWALHYLLFIFLSLALSLPLVRVTHGMIRFAILMLATFILLFVLSAVAAAAGAAGVASVLATVAVLVLGMLLIRQTGLLIFRRIIPKLGFTPPRILEELIILLAYVAWALMRLSHAGLNPSSLVASTAAITAILAFAMQDTLGNILAGLALQLDHSIRIGDWIEADDIKGQVIQVQWRHTAILTLFGEKVLVPNSHLMKTRVSIVGGGAVPKRRRTVLFYSDFSVSSTDVIPAIESSINSAQIRGVSSDDKAVCLIEDFSDGVVVYALRYWSIDPSAPGASDSGVRQHIHAVFQRKGWHMAAPRRAVSLVSRKSYREQLKKAHEHEFPRVVTALQQIDLLAPLNEEEINYLASVLKTLPFVSGSTIATQGEVGESLFIIVSGTVAIWVDADGFRHKVAEVGPGEIIGEMSLLTGQKRRATITAITDLVCYELKKSDFESILDKRPELADSFASLLAQRKLELLEKQSQTTETNQQTEKAAILRRIKRWFA